jgi:hypothetical protein
VRRARPAIVWSLLLLANGLAACSTTYQPRPTQRVGLVIHHGGAAYTHAGQESAIGPFGGDLEGLVADQPVAAARARRSRHQLQAGIPAYLGGLGGVVIGLVLSGPAGWIVLGVGAATAGAGLGLMGAGFTNAVDAINTYNDGVAPPPSLPARHR